MRDVCRYCGQLHTKEMPSVWRGVGVEFPWGRSALALTKQEGP